MLFAMKLKHMIAINVVYQFDQRRKYVGGIMKRKNIR